MGDLRGSIPAVGEPRVFQNSGSLDPALSILCVKGEITYLCPSSWLEHQPCNFERARVEKTFELTFLKCAGERDVEMLSFM